MLSVFASGDPSVPLRSSERRTPVGHAHGALACRSRYIPLHTSPAAAATSAPTRDCTSAARRAFGERLSCGSSAGSTTRETSCTFGSGADALSLAVTVAATSRAWEAEEPIDEWLETRLMGGVMGA